MMATKGLFVCMKLNPRNYNKAIIKCGKFEKTKAKIYTWPSHNHPFYEK